MSQHDDAVRLRHMLDAARKAVSLVAGKARSEVAADELAQLALARLLEIVGEAAGKVSPDCQAAHPEIPWPSIRPPSPGSLLVDSRRLTWTTPGTPTHRQ
jgi:uncharacterized protein with HEPN domain